MVPLSRRVYLWSAWAFLASVIVQVFLIGAYLFSGASIDLHRGFAIVPFLLALVLLATAALAVRDGTWRLSALLVATAFVQGSLPAVAKSVPIAGAFHPVLALVMFWMGTVILRDAQARARGPAEAAAPTGSESVVSAR